MAQSTEKDVGVFGRSSPLNFDWAYFATFIVGLLFLYWLVFLIAVWLKGYFTDKKSNEKISQKVAEEMAKKLKKMLRCTEKAERRAKNKLFGHLTYNNQNYSLEIERTREELLKLQSEMSDTVSVKNFP